MSTPSHAGPKRSRITRTTHNSAAPASYKPTTEATNHARTTAYNDKLTTGPNHSASRPNNERRPPWTPTPKHKGGPSRPSPLRRRNLHQSPLSSKFPLVSQDHFPCQPAFRRSHLACGRYLKHRALCLRAVMILPTGALASLLKPEPPLPHLSVHSFQTETRVGMATLQVLHRNQSHTLTPAGISKWEETMNLSSPLASQSITHRGGPCPRWSDHPSFQRGRG